MGVLDGADWRAKWIGAADTNIPSLRLRREFVVKPGLQRALVNVCGLGEYEMSLDGKKVGDDFLSPGWTKYNKTCLYDTRDITADLKAGKNAIGLELGNGMYNVLGGGRYTKFKGSFGPQKAIAQIRLEYADGTVEIIGTDESWRVAPGPITFTSIYGGEGFDGRLVQRGWNQPGFDDAQWLPAIAVNGPGGELRGLSCAAPPIREFETHQAVSSHTLANGDTVFDLGQNASHVLKISVSGPAGGGVLLYPSELTNEDGSANQSSMGGGHRGSIWCNFTKGTDGVETWSPKFFYVGCRYVQTHCLPATTNGALPNIKSLAGVVVHSASDPVGEFSCSNDLFNRIRTLVRWAQMNNMVSLMTDCPHRERLGWLEEDHLNGPALRYDFDLAQLFTKTLNDIADSQLTNGLVPTTAPEYTIFRSKSDPDHLRNDFGDSPEWSSSLILVPWQQYEFDGDLNLFRDSLRRDDELPRLSRQPRRPMTSSITALATGMTLGQNRRAFRSSRPSRSRPRRFILKTRRLWHAPPLCSAKRMTRGSFPDSRKKSAPRSTTDFTMPPIISTPPIRNARTPFRSSWAFASRPIAPPCWMRLLQMCARAATRSPPATSATATCSAPSPTAGAAT